MGTICYVVDVERRRVLDVGKAYWLPLGGEPMTAEDLATAFAAYWADIMLERPDEDVVLSAQAIMGWIGPHAVEIMTEYHHGDALGLHPWECSEDNRWPYALIPGWSYYRLEESGPVLMPPDEYSNECVARVLPVL